MASLVIVTLLLSVNCNADTKNGCYEKAKNAQRQCINKEANDGSGLSNAERTRCLKVFSATMARCKKGTQGGGGLFIPGKGVGTPEVNSL